MKFAFSSESRTLRRQLKDNHLEAETFRTRAAVGLTAVDVAATCQRRVSDVSMTWQRRVAALQRRGVPRLLVDVVGVAVAVCVGLIVVVVVRHLGRLERHVHVVPVPQLLVDDVDIVVVLAALDDVDASVVPSPSAAERGPCTRQ